MDKMKEECRKRTDGDEEENDGEEECAYGDYAWGDLATADSCRGGDIVSAL